MAFFSQQLDRHQSFRAQNKMGNNNPPECVHHLFERQARVTPDAVAVRSGEVVFTYQELNRHANRLAHHLIALGVRPGTLVGIYVHRSPLMLVGLLGILKAGGAYVPFDPAYPPERMGTMLTDTRVAVLLTQRELDYDLDVLDRLPPSPNLTGNEAGPWPQIVYMNTDVDQILHASDENPDTRVTADHLAYIMYTSGSTGAPKGVMITHRAICNRLRSQAAYSLTTEDRILQHTSLSFDVSVWEIFAPLSHGAQLIIPLPETQTTPADLARLITVHQITLCVFTPALLRVFLQEPGAAHCRSLRCVFCGGEAMPVELQERFFACLSAELYNFYGPTEYSVDATFWACTRAPDQQTVPIGRPIANTSVYILDTQLRPVLLGTAGELYIGGMGLALGYLNRPDSTAECFIPNPFATEPGACLYKTGDMARFRPDGALEFLGRSDRQVKIRGIRIELEEIETILKQHPAVEDVIVADHVSVAGGQHLVAYVTTYKPVELWPSVPEYYIYDELLYDAMTTDARRNQSYQAAIRGCVPGKVVVDLGTGKDAIMARLCVEAEAKKVYAIELQDESYRAALNCIKDLGLDHTIDVIHGDSRQVELPEQVDVCVSEIIGNIGSAEGTLPILNDARRFLKKDGIIIPKSCISKIAAICLPNTFLENPGFSEIAGSYTEKIFHKFGRPFDLRLCVKHLPLSSILSGIGTFEVLDFTAAIKTSYSHTNRLIVERDGRFDGFLVWINLYTSDQEMIDTLRDETSWLPVFIPIFHPGIGIHKGDFIDIICHTHLSDDQLHPDYRIEGALRRRDGDIMRFQYESLYHEQAFKKTSFYAWLFARDTVLIRRSLTIQELTRGIKEHARRFLPDYMVPATIVVLPQMPLTPNGKIDRNALPQPEQYRAVVDRNSHFYKRDDDVHDNGNEMAGVPRNAVEQALVELWAGELGLARVGINDNFFDLGGDSLLALRIVSQANQTGLPITVKQLLHHQTIAELAAMSDPAR